MHRPDATPDHVAQQLDRKARFVSVDAAAVDEEPRRLVDGDDVLVVIEDGQHPDEPAAGDAGADGASAPPVHAASTSSQSACARPW